ncbi:caspase family protein [Rhodopseudomonas sp. RCAM05734]|uniref:caspase family protein n=1 Tax=Rhodopseudomonas sp. RCAM05734 TaxID=3457549 RepID=UPI004044D99B
MRRALLCNLVAAACVMLGAHGALAENRIALVIGQSAYRTVTPLPNPANDAKAIAQLLGDAGFEVQSASDLTQNALRDAVGAFAATLATKGPDTVALVFYAGHGLQIDGENYLVPVDIDPKRETDIPLQAVRLNDVLNTLTAVPSKSRIILLDACRNNPFPDINKTAGRGLALVDARIGAAGTLLSFSTSPGAAAEDGNGGNSPYTTALLIAGREPGLPIEEALKRVRLSVNHATEGRQTPWESSSLVDDFSLFGAAAGAAKISVARRSVEQWRQELKGKPVEAANDLIVSDGSDEAYEAFVGLYAQPPFSQQAREWLDRHRRMVAWNNAVIANSAAGYREFLKLFPDSDLTVTARKLEDRLRNRPDPLGAASSAPAQPTNVALAAPTCPCGAPKKADLPPKKRAETDPPKRVTDRSPPRRMRAPDDEEDIVIVRRPPPPYDGPMPGLSVGGAIGGGYGGTGRGHGSPGRGRY